MASDLYVLSARTKEENRELRAEGYAGKRRFMVVHKDHTPVTVAAGTMQDAIWTAARHWKTDPRKAAFHQGCNVRKVSG